MIEAVRKVILKNLDKDFEEGMQYGMIGLCAAQHLPRWLPLRPASAAPILCACIAKELCFDLPHDRLR